MVRPSITLTTDFGMSDGFVGALKGVIETIAPNTNIIDITHEIPRHDIESAAYVFNNAHRYFPRGTIHIIVVDPGVGTHRMPIGLRTEEATFICPDNGVLSYVFAESVPKVGSDIIDSDCSTVPPDWEAYHLNNVQYQLQPLSSTFHGRDLFAPCAAHLAKGSRLEDMGDRINNLKTFPTAQSQVGLNSVIGEVVHIDRFGNLITNIRSEELPILPLTIWVGDCAIHGIARAYDRVPGPIALIGSVGTIEIAIHKGNAAIELQVSRGTKVHVVTD